MGEARTLTEAMRTAIEGALLETRTCTPVEVQSYDATSQRATVVPLLKRKTAAGEVIESKPVANVPVLHLRAGGFCITLPVAAGDVGLLLCSDRSLDLWKEQGGKVDPQSGRHHSMDDGVFLPGLHHWGDPVQQSSSSSLIIGAEDGLPLLRMTPAGEVKITATAVRLGDPDATAALALATLVDARLTTLQAAHDAHVHPVPGVTVGAGATTSSVTATPVGALASTAATKAFGA